MIEKPISLKCILTRINAPAEHPAEAASAGTGDDKGADGWYTTMQDFMDDVELIFSNAREYNVEESDVYQDADTLEAVVTKAYKKVPPREAFAPYLRKCNTLYLITGTCCRLVSHTVRRDMVLVVSVNGFCEYCG